MAIEWMVNKYGINHVGLLTLSFGVPGSGRGSQATKELRELAKDYLRDIIASIPIPLVFGKGSFESGVAAKLLTAYADDPLAYLDPESKRKMAMAYRMLWRKFEEIAFDASAGARWQESELQEADNIDVGPLTEADLNGELFATSENPF